MHCEARLPLQSSAEASSRVVTGLEKNEFHKQPDHLHACLAPKVVLPCHHAQPDMLWQLQYSTGGAVQALPAVLAAVYLHVYAAGTSYAEVHICMSGRPTFTMCCKACCMSLEVFQVNEVAMTSRMHSW